ncbi:MAG: hypothetical protein K2J60_05510 [Acetatifactor sp.]|nr:hypothetical protein [Acetatifactor sp.]
MDKDNWISISTELPKDRENVQVTYIGFPDNVHYCDGFAYLEEGIWYWTLNDDKCNVPIIAWKENCEPYRWQTSLPKEEERILKFEYHILLEKGYCKVMETEETDTVSFVIEARNRVTADRAVKAMLECAPNVIEYDGTCIEH